MWAPGVQGYCSALCPQHLEQYLAQGRWVIHVFQMNESLNEQTGCMCSSKSCLSGWYTLSPHLCHNWERKESHFCGVYILVVEADFVSTYSLGASEPKRRTGTKTAAQSSSLCWIHCLFFGWGCHLPKLCGLHMLSWAGAKGGQTGRQRQSETSTLKTSVHSWASDFSSPCLTFLC